MLQEWLEKTFVRYWVINLDNGINTYGIFTQIFHTFICFFSFLLEELHILADSD